MIGSAVGIHILCAGATGGGSMRNPGVRIATPTALPTETPATTRRLAPDALAPRARFMSATIDISELRIGYTLGAPIYDEKNVKLLGQGVTIAEKFISQLRRRGIRTVQVTEDDLAKLRGWRLSVDPSPERAPNASSANLPEPESRIDQTRFRRFLAAISQVGRRARTTVRPFRIIRDAAQLAADALHAEHYGFGLALPNNQGMTFLLGARASHGEQHKLSLYNLELADDQSLLTASLAANSPLLVENLLAGKRFSDEFLAELQIQSAVLAPLYRGTLRAGSMALFYRQAKRLDDHDLSFFETIANIVTVPREIDPDELNAEADDLNDLKMNRRYDYHCWQGIAPLDGEQIPSPAAYEEVLCHDISMGGFSFYYPRRPGFSQLAVALGKPPHLKQMKAVVVSCCGTEVDGAPCALVGCRFAGPLIAS